jgi:hypothetical protein
MSNLRTTLDHLASVFASSVLDAIRGASLQEILAESAGGAGGGRRGGRSRLEASVVSETGSHLGAPSSPAGARRRRGRLARRSAGDISQIVDSIVSLLERRPDGLRAEQIRAELGLEAKELPRPIAEALAGKRINKQGQKRATTYFARGSSPRAASGGASSGSGRGRAKKSAGAAATGGTAKKTRGAGKRAGKTAKKAGRKGGRGSSGEAGSSGSAESA